MTVAEQTAVAEPHVDQPGRFAYRPALDGLRAIAVIGVMLYHGAQLSSAPLTIAPGGFLGVDLFMVLSGYLITTLLLLEWIPKRTIDIRGFYLRRARRLVPALLLVIGAVTIAFLLPQQTKLGATELAHFRRDMLSSLFYAANWSFAFSGQSYFDQFGGPSPLRHMWSLAIEEQFYLVWPALLFVGLRWLRLRRRGLAIAALVAVWASALLMAIMYSRGGDVSRVYYGTDTRAQALLTGALLAVVLVHVPIDRLRSRRLQMAGLIALVGLLVAFRFATDDLSVSGWLYTGGFLAVAAMGALVIAAAAGPPGTPAARLLSWAPLVWIGTLSYGLYLWHWPVFVIVDSELTHLGGAALLAVRWIVTLALAVGCYYAVEAPIRFGALHRTGPRLLAMGAVAATALLIGYGVAVVQAPPADLATLTDEQAAQFNTDLPPAHDGNLRVLLVGDSVALSLGYYRPELAGIAVKTSAIIGCGIVRGKLLRRDKPAAERAICDTWPDNWSRAVDEFAPDVSVMMIGAWEVFDHEVNGRAFRVGSKEYEDYIVSELETGLQILVAKGRPVIMVTSPCFAVLQPGGPSDEAERLDTRRVDWLNGIITAFAQRHAKQVRLLDLHGYLCPDGSYHEVIDGVKLHNDGVHFTEASAPLVWTWLLPHLDVVRR